MGRPTNAELAARAAENAAESNETAVPETKAKSSGSRKDHWPQGFKPTGDKMKDTKALLDLEEKVSFMVPLGPEEKPGMEEIVQVNGWKYTIKKGHMVKVPLTVANMLARKYRVEMEVMEKAQAASKPELNG